MSWTLWDKYNIIQKTFQLFVHNLLTLRFSITFILLKERSSCFKFTRVSRFSIFSMILFASCNFVRPVIIQRWSIRRISEAQISLYNHIQNYTISIHIIIKFYKKTRNIWFVKLFSSSKFYMIDQNIHKS